MHIDLRDERRQRLFAVDVDLSAPPAIVHAPDHAAQAGQVVHLDWDRALDDEQHLRHCPACGCRELFARKALPQLTAFVVILFAGAIAILLYSQVNPIAALVLFVVMAAADASIYLFMRRELVCYRCRSVFSGMPIRRDHPRWDRSRADQHLPEAGTDAAASPSEMNEPAAAPGEPADAASDKANTP